MPSKTTTETQKSTVGARKPKSRAAAPRPVARKAKAKGAKTAKGGGEPVSNFGDRGTKGSGSAG